MSALSSALSSYVISQFFTEQCSKGSILQRYFCLLVSHFTERSTCRIRSVSDVDFLWFCRTSTSESGMFFRFAAAVVPRPYTVSFLILIVYRSEKQFVVQEVLVIFKCNNFFFVESSPVFVDSSRWQFFFHEDYRMFLVHYPFVAVGVDGHDQERGYCCRR
jgi:hypothetical protein